MHKALNNLGLVYSKLQDHPAQSKRSKAIQLKPDFPEAYYNLGIAYYGDGQFNDAV